MYFKHGSFKNCSMKGYLRNQNGSSLALQQKPFIFEHVDVDKGSFVGEQKGCFLNRLLNLAQNGWTCTPWCPLPLLILTSPESPPPCVWAHTNTPPPQRWLPAWKSDEWSRGKNAWKNGAAETRERKKRKRRQRDEWRPWEITPFCRKQ